MKKNIGLLIGAIIASIVLVAAGVTVGVLKATEVIKGSFTAFQLLFLIFTYGFGLIALIYGIINKGGYEKAIGLTLIDVAVVLHLIFAKVFWVVTLIVALGLVILTILLMIVFNVSKLQVARTNEQEDFKSYTEVLKEQKEEEKANEEPMPEIKSFKNNLK